MSAVKRTSDAKGSSSKKPKTIREQQVSIPEVALVLKPVRELKRVLPVAQDASKILKQMEGVTEVEDLETTEVMSKIEDLVVTVVSQILEGNSFELNVPNRGAGNQRYIEDIDRIVLGNKMTKRLFLNTGHVRKTAITTRVVQLVHEVLAKKIHITKRDLFCKSWEFSEEMNYSCLYIYIL